jgi:hypothetical protein
MGQALGPELTAYVAAVSRARAHADERSTASFTSARDRAENLVTSRLGPAIGGALTDTFRTYQAAALGLAPGRAGLDALTGSVQQLAAALRDAGLPYFLDFFPVGDGEPVLTSYYVGRERTGTFAGSSARLLWVERLDDLNKSLAVLGYTSPRLGAGLVTLDRIEQDVVQFVAPALGEGSARLVDRETRETEQPWIAELERAAGQALRRDYERYRTPSQDALVALIGRREGGDAVRVAFRDMLSRVAERVERHELQHQIDFRAGLVVTPGELLSVLGIGESEAATDGLAARCRDELSAGLADVATDPDLASTELTLWMPSLFDRTRWSTPYAYAAAVLLTSVARELGVGGDGAGTSRRLERPRAKEIFVAVVAQGGDAIARAASRAYERLYGRSLVPVTLGPWSVSRAWRY